MDSVQFEIFKKILKTRHVAKVDNITYEIAHNKDDIYELFNYSGNSRISLKVGTFNECYDVAILTVKMIYGI